MQTEFLLNLLQEYPSTTIMSTFCCHDDALIHIENSWQNIVNRVISSTKITNLASIGKSPTTFPLSLTVSLPKTTPREELMDSSFRMSSSKLNFNTESVEFGGVSSELGKLIPSLGSECSSSENDFSWVKQ